MRFNQAQLAEASATIWGLLCEGKSDIEIMDEMGISAEDFSKLKNAMFDLKADEIRARPTEHTFVQYMLDQIGNVSALTDMIDNFKNTKQYNAMVGAIRARSEIYDKIIARGQEFGIIHKKAERKEIVAGVLVADLTNKQLKSMITGELSKLNGMMKRYGDSNILDIPSGDIYTGEGDKELADRIREKSEKAKQLSAKPTNHPSTKEKKASKTQKAKTNKRHAGRSMVRIKAKQSQDAE